MQQRTIACACIASVLAVSVAAQEESRVRIYGFMDMLASTVIVEDNSLFQSLTTHEGTMLGLEHLNIYLDARPSDDIRFLSELSFMPKPVKSGARVGAEVVLDAGNGLVVEIPVNAGMAPASNTYDNPDRGMVFEWGEVAVERAWAEYTVREWLAFRFGKFITPAGIWNVDHGSPVLVTVRQPYQTGLLQFFPKSQLGLLATGSLFAGTVDIDYHVYFSSGRNGIDIREVRDLAVGARLEGSMPLLGATMGAGLSGYSGMDNAAYKTRTVTVDPQTMQRFAGEAIVETGNFNINDSSVQAVIQRKINEWMIDEGLNPRYHDYTTTYEYKARETSLGVDLKYKWRRLQLQAELNYELVENYLRSESRTEQLGFYVLATYGIPVGSRLRVSPYVMYELIRAAGSDNNPQMYLSGEKTGTGYSIVDGFQSVVAGLNVKLSSYITVKAEYVLIDVITGGNAADIPRAMDVSFVNFQFAVAY